MNTNKGSIVKQPGNDVEGCRSEKVLVQPNMCVFLQYSVKTIFRYQERDHSTQKHPIKFSCHMTSVVRLPVA